MDKVYTWGADGLVSQRLVGTNVSYWYHFSPQGETRHLTNSIGTVVGTYSYDAYGKQLQSTGGINNNFRYGGKYGYYYDEQVYGMYLAGARWYAPDLYRWMSRDPIEYAGGDNMFAYVAGNPVMYVDVDGLSPRTQWQFHPYDHGGPHFQIEDNRGISHRYNPKTLEPIKHKGHCPPRLSNADIDQLQKTRAWQRWLKYSKQKGSVGLKILGRLGGILGVIGDYIMPKDAL